MALDPLFVQGSTINSRVPTLEPLSESVDFDLYGDSPEGVKKGSDALFQALESAFQEKQKQNFFRYDKGLSLDENLFQPNLQLSRILSSMINEELPTQEPRAVKVETVTEVTPDEKGLILSVRIVTSEFGASDVRKYLIDKEEF